MKPIKGEISETTTCRKEYKIVTNDKMCEPYWEDGRRYHKSRGRRKNKQVHCFQRREYRSWKHNRKTQWT